MNEIHEVLGAIQIDRAERKASPLDANAGIIRFFLTNIANCDTVIAICDWISLMDW